MRHASRPAPAALLPALLAALALAAGCSGSSPPAAAATGLDYADPAGTGWRLVRSRASTSTRLVLELFGPDGEKTRGVGFNLQAPPAVRFAPFENGLPVDDTGVYELLSRDLDPNEPVALAGGVKPGNLLTVGIFQKDRTWRAKDSGVALLRIALELDPAAGATAGQALELALRKAAVIPEDIGRATDDAWTLDRKMRMAPVQIAVGRLTAR